MVEQSEIRQGLRYTEEHEWVRVEDDIAVVGITDHAQQALGEITYVDMPPMGKQVTRGDDLAAVESAKAASDVFAPIGGTVVEINPLLEEAPEKINQSPYDDGWIVKLNSLTLSDLDALLTPQQYRELLETEPE